MFFAAFLLQNRTPICGNYYSRLSCLNWRVTNGKIGSSFICVYTIDVQRYYLLCLCLHVCTSSSAVYPILWLYAKSVLYSCNIHLYKMYANCNIIPLFEHKCMRYGTSVFVAPQRYVLHVHCVSVSEHALLKSQLSPDNEKQTIRFPLAFKPSTYDRNVLSDNHLLLRKHVSFQSSIQHPLIDKHNFSELIESPIQIQSIHHCTVPFNPEAHRSLVLGELRKWKLYYSASVFLEAKAVRYARELMRRIGSRRILLMAMVAHLLERSEKVNETVS